MDGFPTSDSASRIGVVGGGQLARMLQQSAITLGIELVVLGDQLNGPAAQVVPHHRVGSMPPTADDLGWLASMAPVITFEHEVLDLEAVAAIEAAGTMVAPQSSTLARVIDKAAMRTTMAEAGLPGPMWRVVEQLDQLEETFTEIPNAVIKVARGGYDGRGVVITNSTEQAHNEAARLLAEGHVLLIEERLDLDAEIAVVAVRGRDGSLATYAPVRTIQAAGQCRQVDFPSGLDTELEQRARGLAERAARAVEVVGLLAVEMFVVGDRVLINELAARPHNSGHLTIEAAATSQFENHLRAVAGLPLGSTEPVVGAATMVNLIGSTEVIDPMLRRNEGLAVADSVHLHLYGKSVRPERKVGHVTICATGDETPAEMSGGALATTAWRVAAALGAAPMPRDSDKQGFQMSREHR